jgi:MFS family permease
VLQRTLHPLLALATIGLGASIAPLDFAVNVAFPAITLAFALAVQDIRWLVITYVLTYAVLMLACGRLGDRIGHRAVFRAGLIAGALAFVVCALAPTYAWLLAARALQGVATALVLSCAPALVVAACGDARRTWALSRYTMIAAIASIAGPLVGGVAIALMGWAGVFWFRLPVVMLALLLLAALPVLPASPVNRPVQHSAQRTAEAGAINANNAAWRAHITSVAVNFTGFAIPLLVPYYLARIAGHDATTIGVMLAAASAGVLAGATVAPRLIHRAGQYGASLIAAGMVALAQGAIAVWPPTAAMLALLPGLVLHGLGIGVFQVAYADTVMAGAHETRHGAAGSLTVLTRTIGVILSAMVLSSALQMLETRALADGLAAAEAFHWAFRRVMLWSGLGLAILIAVLGGWSGDTAPRTPKRRKW